MNSFIPFAVLWVLVAIVVMALVAYRKLVSLQEEETLHLTKRDQFSNTLEDMFDFDNSPSINTPLTQAAPPVNDCTP